MSLPIPWPFPTQTVDSLCSRKQCKCISLLWMATDCLNMHRSFCAARDSRIIFATVALTFTSGKISLAPRQHRERWFTRHRNSSIIISCGRNGMPWGLNKIASKNYVTKIIFLDWKNYVTKIIFLDWKNSDRKFILNLVLRWGGSQYRINERFQIQSMFWSKVYIGSVVCNF